MPSCRSGIFAGFVLAFARALGEYGATSMLIGYTEGYTDTISTTVAMSYSNGKYDVVIFWVLINILISTVVMVAVNLIENRDKKGAKK